MSWRVIGAAYYPFGFVDPPEELTVENDTTHETVRYVPERTCHIEYHYGEWYCHACGQMVGTCDTASILHIDGNAIELWGYCPMCGAKVVDA